jgi:glycyl-tRNA synthetase
MRHRADKLVEEWNTANGITDVLVEAMDNNALVAYIPKSKSPAQLWKERLYRYSQVQFDVKNLPGLTEDSAATVYLRLRRSRHFRQF